MPPHALRGLGGEHEVLRREVVLFLRCAVVHSVAVQGVEGPAAQPLTQGHGDVDVVFELTAAGWPGHQAPVAPSHVTGEEVEADKLHVGVGNGSRELLHFGIGGDGDRPRPPELDRVEAGLLGSLRTFKQGQLGEQDRKVDVVWQIAPPGAPIP